MTAPAEYCGVFGECTSEKTIEKSVFLSFSKRVKGEEEARDYLASLHALHLAATHICYGYIADSLGNLQRFSDDGEPQGTAGMPILGVIKSKNLRETLVAVVRYFGGIKLGAGGLTRAYASSAQGVLSLADIRKFSPCTELIIEVGYSDVDRTLRFLDGYEVLAKEFGEGAAFTVAVKEEDEAAIKNALCDALGGRVTFRTAGHSVRPFLI